MSKKQTSQRSRRKWDTHYSAEHCQYLANLCKNPCYTTSTPCKTMWFPWKTMWLAYKTMLLPCKTMWNLTKQCKFSIRIAIGAVSISPKKIDTGHCAPIVRVWRPAEKSVKTLCFLRSASDWWQEPSFGAGNCNNQLSLRFLSLLVTPHHMRTY